MTARKRKRRPWIPGPDHRNTARGTDWLKNMIETSEAMDAGKKNKTMTDVLDTMQTPLLSKREREPGEEG